MARMMFYIIILYSLCIPSAHADERPTASIMLHEGDNTITFALSNGWNRDIRNLTVSLGEESTPSWVEFVNSDEPVTIMAGKNGDALLSFDVSVTNAPSTENTRLPVVLADDAGNLWTIPLSVSTLSSGDGPPVFDTALSTNYPNPFNPTTTIPYSIANSSHVELTIYNITGQKVRTLVNEHQLPGSYAVVWNGHDNQGRAVSSGVYLCRFMAGGFQSVQRMMLIE